MSLEQKHLHNPRGNREVSVLTATAYGSSASVNRGLGGYSVGSDIAGGRFIVNSPDYIHATSRVDRTVMLPDRLGIHLFHNDQTTDYSAEIPTALDKDGLFRFIGVSMYGGNTCKDECNDKASCCPLGYTDEQSRWNFFPIRTPVDIATTGVIAVYAESEFTPNDDVYVRVEVTDADVVPCQLLGGVTSIADKGTQPVGSNVRVELGCVAGSSVMLDLGGLSPQ